MSTSPKRTPLKNSRHVLLATFRPASVPFKVYYNLSLLPNIMYGYVFVMMVVVHARFSRQTRAIPFY